MEGSEIGYHEHELRVATEGSRIGNLLVAVNLPEGESLFESNSFVGGRWEPPALGSFLPGGLPEVEYYLDGVCTKRGAWPHLQPVG